MNKIYVNLIKRVAWGLTILFGVLMSESDIYTVSVLGYTAIGIAIGIVGQKLWPVTHISKRN